MKKAAAKRESTTDDAGIDLDQYSKALEAKQQFVGATLNMGWRMALTVVIPIVVGVKVDQRFDTSPSWTLVGLMLAAFGACVAVWDTVKEVNQIQADSEEESKQDDN